MKGVVVRRRAQARRERRGSAEGRKDGRQQTSQDGTERSEILTRLRAQHVVCAFASLKRESAAPKGTSAPGIEINQFESIGGERRSDARDHVRKKGGRKLKY